MQYLIYDPKSSTNKYFLGGDKGCFNSGWGPLKEVLSIGVFFHRNEPRKETTLEWLQRANEDLSSPFQLLLQAESITLKYVQQHRPELLI